MTAPEVTALAAQARDLGYRPLARRLLGGSWRLYLTRPDGRWTFCGGEEDLDEVHAQESLWHDGRDAPAFFGTRPDRM